MSNLKELMQHIPQTGSVELITIRPERRGEVKKLDEIMVSAEEGLIGDHYSGSSKKRQVTLIQKEHLDVVANILKKELTPL